LKEGKDINKVADSFKQFKKTAPDSAWNKISEEINNPLDEKLAQSFESEGEKAPESLWQAISTEIDRENVDEVVNSSFYHYKRIAPEGIWNEIKKTVIIDSVWTRVISSLDRKILFNRYVWRAILVTTLFLLAPYVLVDQQHHASILHKGGNEENIELANQSKSVIKSSSDIEITKNVTPMSNVEQDQRKPNVWQNYEEPNSAQESLSEHGSLSSENDTLKKYSISDPFLFGSTVANVIQPDSIIDVESESRYWTLGISGALNQTWVLNSQTLNGFNANSLVQNKISLGYEFGVNALVTVGKKSYFLLNATPFTRINQSSNQFEQGAYNSDNIQVSYAGLSIGFGKEMGNISVDGSLYFYQQLKEKNYRNSILLEESNLRKQDVGAKISIRKEVSIANIPLRLGAHIQGSLININQGSGLIPIRFNPIRNANIGLEIEYLLRR